jgi:excisionase family DNA binding protein
MNSDQEVLLTPAEVASLFRVDPKTVTRWAKSGKLTSIRTLGGHRRYKESEVKELLLKTTSNSQRMDID